MTPSVPPGLAAAFAVALAVLVAGCSFSRPALDRSTYALGASRTGAPAAQAKPVALRVRPFRAVAPYDVREFLYRKADGQLVTDFYNSFPTEPGELVTSATTQWLKSSGLFAVVLEPGVSVDAQYLLEGSVIALYADLTDAKRPASVLEVQVYLVRVAPAGRDLVLDRRFAERVEVGEPSPAALAKGYNQALERILQRLERELATADLKP